MKNKQFLIYGLVLVVLAVLMYVQFRTWKNFDWATFWSYRINPRNIVYAVGLIYFTYFLRAWRWAIFLRPVRKGITPGGLLPPTIIGFTGLALLGRAGELIRPYLIARRTKLGFSSQMAVWTVERIFDVGAFTILLIFAIFVPGTSLHDVQKYSGVRIFGLLFLALATGLSLAAALVAKYGETVSVWVERRLSRLAADLGHRISQRLREFHQGLDTIHGLRAFCEISGVSIAMWGCIALSYFQVVLAYGSHFQQMKLSKVFPLMGSSMVGSLIQLPGVGGGSQLATISALEHVFGAKHELAASCGILLWLVTFVSIVPAGLLLAHQERLSLRRVSDESHLQEEAATASVARPPS